MFCSACGKEIAGEARFCSGCGNLAPHLVRDQSVNDGTVIPVWLFCVAGAMIGAIIGYLTRPSALLVGQLPFGIVVTGGATLQGLDQLLVPIAQQSFNQMLTGTILGAVLAGVAGMIFRRLNLRAA